MTDDQTNAKRGPDGRFLPGNKPPRSTGRPPGSRGVNARAAHLANERLETLLGKAAHVIDEALDDGDSQVATWLIDRIRPHRAADFVPIAIQSDLENPKEAVEAAREAVLAVGRGEISLTEARSYVTLLERLGGMLGHIELESLRQMISEMKATQPQRRGAFDQSRLPPDCRIQWGQGVASSSPKS